jgi:hypothetical protein
VRVGGLDERRIGRVVRVREAVGEVVLRLFPDLPAGGGCLGVGGGPGIRAGARDLPTARDRACGRPKPALHEIWQADSRAAAEKAFDRFVATYEAKYPKAVGCLVKDRAELLAFYDFPAVHWQHIRTTNPIESTFATIRLRTRKTRNCVTARSGLSLMYQLAMSAQKRWRRLRGFRQLADVIAGIKFVDGVDERTISRKAA